MSTQEWLITLTNWYIFNIIVPFWWKKCTCPFKMNFLNLYLDVFGGQLMKQSREMKVTFWRKPNRDSSAMSIILLHCKLAFDLSISREIAICRPNLTPVRRILIGFSSRYLSSFMIYSWDWDQMKSSETSIVSSFSWHDFSNLHLNAPQMSKQSSWSAVTSLIFRF